MMIRLLLCVMLLSLLSSCAETRTIKNESGNGSNPMSSIIKFYQGPLNHFSSVRYSECPMYPSDSYYGLQSLKKHGFLIGSMMTFDRLIRCGRDELTLSPGVIVDGKPKSYDPVEQNDFWWYKK